ncbi:MAG: ImmA/IrrE family metallo-endopeptidase [Alphaproteobacteria bacterium]|nr:ImmA/IrrE family metallo-endopeptidase [Alphaproteobacteria bacterium]
MTIYQPIPCRATKAAIQAATEQYATLVGYTPGGDLRKTIIDLGGHVLYRDLFQSVKSGRESIHVRSESDFDVFLPIDTSPSRDRFTLAHELAHLALHYPMVKKAHLNEPDVEMVADRFLPDSPPEELKRCEWEANWFAAAFLMPAGPFRKIWDQSNGNLHTLSQHFMVSPAAAENRIKSLKQAGQI